MAREMFQFNLINDLPPVDCVHDLKTGATLVGDQGSARFVPSVLIAISNSIEHKVQVS